MVVRLRNKSSIFHVSFLPSNHDNETPEGNCRSKVSFSRKIIWKFQKICSESKLQKLKFGNSINKNILTCLKVLGDILKQEVLDKLGR